jgi:adenylate cyclase
VHRRGRLSAEDEALLTLIAEGRPIKVIAAAQHTTPASVAARIERLFVTDSPRACRPAMRGSLERLKTCTGRSWTARSRASRCRACCPAGSPTSCAARDARIGETERLEVTVLMSDIRAYSTIAERTDPSLLARQLNEHRAAMNRAIIGHDGTVMQFVGDAVMAVFGAPDDQDDHADRAVDAAGRMHRAAGHQRTLDRRGAGTRSGSGSACPPARWPPPCSARRSDSSTRWSATP